jgi:hypothetical protein
MEGNELKKKYLKPKSLTWLAGILLIVYGVWTKQYNSIAEGLALIGIRGAIGD